MAIAALPLNSPGAGFTSQRRPKSSDSRRATFHVSCAYNEKFLNRRLTPPWAPAPGSNSAGINTLRAGVIAPPKLLSVCEAKEPFPVQFTLRSLVMRDVIVQVAPAVVLQFLSSLTVCEASEFPK